MFITRNHWGSSSSEITEVKFLKNESNEMLPHNCIVSKIFYKGEFQVVLRESVTTSDANNSFQVFDPACMILLFQIQSSPKQGK